MQSENPVDISFIKKVLSVIGMVLLFSVAVFLIVVAYRVVLLAFGGILFAVLLDGLTDLTRKFIKLSRNWSFFVSLTVFTAFIAGSSWLVGPPIVDQVIKLTEQLPQALDKIKSSIMESSLGKQILGQTSSGINGSMGKDVLGYAARFFSSTFTFLTDFLIIIILGIYLAATPGLYTKNLTLLFSEENRPRVNQLFRNWGKALKWWLIGRFASMIVVGILTGIGLWIVGMNLALAFGIIAALLSFIPFIGPLISFIPAFLLSFTQSPTMALYVLIVYLTVQTLESYLITPLIEKSVVSLPPALVIFMQVLMGFVFGILGVLFASPIAVVLIILIQILYVKNYLGEDVQLLSNTEKV